MNATFQGLTTFNIGIPVAGAYYLSGKLQLPTTTEGAPANSQVVVTITQTPASCAGGASSGCMLFVSAMFRTV